MSTLSKDAPKRVGWIAKMFGRERDNAECSKHDAGVAEDVSMEDRVRIDRAVCAYLSAIEKAVGPDWPEVWGEYVKRQRYNGTQFHVDGFKKGWHPRNLTEGERLQLGVRLTGHFQNNYAAILSSDSNNSTRTSAVIKIRDEMQGYGPARKERPSIFETILGCKLNHEQSTYLHNEFWSIFSKVWPTAADRCRLQVEAENKEQAQRAKQEKESQRKKEAFWRRLSGTQFEVHLGEIYLQKGYEVTHTGGGGDGGVDLILVKDGRKTVVQCKAHNKRISIGTARQLYASKLDFKADAAVIACLEGVTGPVNDYINSRGIAVIDVRDIVELAS